MMTTFELDTPAPGARDWIALIVGAAALIAGLLLTGQTWYIQAALTVGGVVFTIAGAAAVLNWIIGMSIIRMAQLRELHTITADTVIWDKQINLVHEQTRLVDRLAVLNRDQLAYARELGTMPAIEIDGARVIWVVEDTRVPLYFVSVWAEALATAKHGELPSQSSFDGQPQREACREYHRAIVAALVRMGAAVQPAGPYAARWIVNQGERQAALDRIGFSLALAIAQETETDEQTNQL